MVLTEEILGRIQQYINDDKYPDAIEMLKSKIEEEQPGDETLAVYYFNIGKLYYQKDDFINAREYLVKALHCDKFNYYAKFLSCTYMRCRERL